MLQATIFGLIMTLIFALYNGLKITERHKKPLNKWTKTNKIVSLSVFGVMIIYTFLVMFDNNAALAAFSVMALFAWRDQANKWIRLKVAGSYAEAAITSRTWHGISIGLRSLWMFVAVWRIFDGSEGIFTWWQYIALGLAVNVLYDLIINLTVPLYKTFHVDTRKHSFNYNVVNKLLGGREWLFWVLKGLVVLGAILLVV